MKNVTSLGVVAASILLVGACKKEVSLEGLLVERHQITVDLQSFEQCEYADAVEVAGDMGRSEQHLSSFGCSDDACDISGSSKDLHDAYFYPMLDDTGSCVFAEFTEFKSEPYFVGSVQFGNDTLRKLGLSVKDIEALSTSDFAFVAGKNRGFQSDYETHTFSTHYPATRISDTLTILGKQLQVTYQPEG